MLHALIWSSVRSRVWQADGSFSCVDATGRESMRVTHSTVELGTGDDMQALNVMDVTLPAYATGRLESIRPNWNARDQTFQLKFDGRAKLASARNFQLVGAGGRSRVLLYGKLEEDEFALDFAHPLSTLHALAIVTTTSSW